MKPLTPYLIESYSEDISLKWATNTELKDFIKKMNAKGLQPEEQNLLDAMSKKVLGAFKRSKMIAGITFKESDQLEDTTIIEIILVDPNNRKNGIGTMLVDYVIKNRKTKNIITNPYTDDAGKFFKYLGFKEDESFDPNDTNVMILKK